MLMPKETRAAIYAYIFKEGVIVAKDDFSMTKHNEIHVSNLHVLKLMQSMVSRGLVRKQYAWRHHYYFLENKGVEYIREYLHLPPELVPDTLQGPRKQQSEGRRSDDFRGGNEKRGTARPGFQPNYEGYGRGGRS